MTSRTISSNQAGIHERLESTVRKHLETPFLRPIPDYSQRVFDQHFAQIDNFNGPLVFDSYCGVGESTVNLAAQMPDALVIGLDKSAHRLARHPHQYARPGIDNYLLIRADVDDFWRQAQQAGWRLAHHFLLYPNPWPKSAQLKRRCHASPLFPVILELGGQLELRSNWQLYIEEFAEALEIAGIGCESGVFHPQTAITPFERKYRDSGQVLWRLRCQLD